MKAETVKAVKTAFRIARAYVNAEYAKNHLQASLDMEFAKANVEKQIDIIDLSEELEQGAKDFEEEFCNDNNN